MKQSKLRYKNNIARVHWCEDYDNDIWMETLDVTPTRETHPDAFYSYHTYPYQKIHKPISKRKPYFRLSNRQLRNRLYQAGVRGSEISRLAHLISAPPQDSETHGAKILGWKENDLRAILTPHQYRKITQFVQPLWLLLDEYGSYVNDGFMKMAAKARSLCFKFIQCVQTFPINGKKINEPESIY